MGIQVVAGANSCNGMGLKVRIIEYDPAYLFTFHSSLFTLHFLMSMLSLEEEWATIELVPSS